MITDDLIKGMGSWLSVDDSSDVIISSRVRLARNIDGHRFPNAASEDERGQLCAELHQVLSDISCLEKSFFFDMGVLDVVDKEVLKERHLISHELCSKSDGSGLVVARDEGIGVMINEEDHLRLQAMSPGMNLSLVWNKLNALDSELEKRVEYAFSPRLGYLTACITNVGTGLRASVMMHLMGLYLMNEVESVVRGLNKMGFAVRGLLGEGTEAFGSMFQVSNQTTLGETEEGIISRLIEIVEEVAGHERNARARLMEGGKMKLMDRIGRAFGILTNARLISSREAIELLSVFRLGVEMGVIKGLPVCRINEIMLLTQPGHLQKTMGRILGPQERDECRAELVKRKLAGIRFEGMHEAGIGRRDRIAGKQRINTGEILPES